MSWTMDHDVICAQEVNQMYNLGCFAEQFVTYSTCCLLGQTCAYFVSDKAENAYQFAQHKLNEDIFCLPVHKQTQEAMVPSGHRENLSLQFKRQAAQRLKEEGAGEAARLVSSLAKPANNAAQELLEQLKKTLTGCFEEEKLQIFAGLVQFAFNAKKVTPLYYLKCQQWLADVMQDIEEERIKHAMHERVYTGFAYLKQDGSAGYYYNAVKAMTLERQGVLRSQKQLVTPIFRKRYCFQDIDQLNDIAMAFKTALRSRLDTNYLAVLQQIYQLPGPIEKENFREIYNQQSYSAHVLSVQALNYYGVLWNVW